MGPLLPPPNRLRRCSLRLGCLLLLLLLAALTRARAQTPTPLLQPDKVPFDFYERGPYRPDVPRPATLLGYEPGEFHTTYANYERFLRELAPKTDRLHVFTVGQTPEHRPLYLLAVSTPDNLARLDAIKSDLALLADPRKCSEEDAAAIAARSPMVVWLSYSIHGDESSAFEAGMQVLYQLTASDDPKIVDALRQCVVLINPAQNPDGHERFTAWYNAQGLGRPEAFAFEHRQPWGIYGRFNHYLFDLNRDLLPGSQIESRAQMASFLEWHPQVNADHHGETKNFFFPPPAVPVNSALPHDETEKWQSLMGKGNAAAFNRYSWLYYSRDVFDLYYPGYWDSWPSLHGSTGMTFESDGGGKRGFNWKRDDGTIETLREAIAKHFTASLATLQTSVDHRQERLGDYYRFFAGAMAEGNAGKDGLRQVAISPGSDPGKAAELVANLLRHGIEVRRTSEKLTLNNAHDYLSGIGSPTAAREFPPGSYLVDLAQPQGRMVRTLLAPDAPLDSAFVKRQWERQARNLLRGRREPLEKAEFYDITSWCLPLAFGVDAAYTGDAPASPAVGEYVLKADPISVTLSDQPGAGGQEHTVALAPEPPAAKAVTAYLWTPETEGAYRMAFRLLQEGYHLATATYPMRAGGRDYPRGSLLARVERNPASLHERVKTLAKELGVAVSTADTAYVDAGSNVGPGSEDVVSLKVPKVALIAGDGVAQTSYAEISYLLGKDMGVEFVPMSVSAFRKTRMADFNVLILPDGSTKDYSEAFDKDGVDKLKAWCKDGGTLICVGGAAGFAADKKVDLTGSRVVGADMLAKLDDDKDSSDKDEEAAAGKPPADKDHQPEGQKAVPVTGTGTDKAKDTGTNMAEEPSMGKDLPGKSTDVKTLAKIGVKKEEFDRRKIPLAVPGATFHATLNRDHFLTFGYESDTLPVLVDTDQFLTLTKRGANVVTFPAAPEENPYRRPLHRFETITGLPLAPEENAAPPPLRLAGFTWPDNTEKLIRGTAAMVEEPLGDGHVILTANGPSFRMLWRASTRLWLNGLLYAPAIHGSGD